MDPDKSGHLTYQEFSRAFFARRNRNKKKPKRLKPHWTPNNASQARTHFSEGRNNCVAMGAEYKPKKTKSKKRTKIVVLCGSSTNKEVIRQWKPVAGDFQVRQVYDVVSLNTLSNSLSDSLKKKKKTDSSAIFSKQRWIVSEIM